MTTPMPPASGPLIDRVDTFVLRLDAASAYLGDLPTGPPGPGYQVRPPWRSLYSDRYETLLVRVTADDGTTGWGEALAPVAPQVPALIVEALLAPQLLGTSATRPRTAWYRLREFMRERGHLGGHQADALAAVDIALWDLAGRVCGRSVCDLVGGGLRDQVPVYVSGLPRPTDAGRADLARAWRRRGADAVKLHLGHGVAADLATVDAVRAAAPDLRVAVDAHWAYDVGDALALAAGLDDRGVWFLEAPLAPEDVAGHAELVRRTRLPIAVGEALRHRYEFDAWIDARALRIAQPDVARTGITELLAIGELCAARFVPLAPHHSVGLGVAAAAGLQVSAAVELLHSFEYQPTSLAVGEPLLRDPLVVGPGVTALPGRPGLGVEVDAAAVARLAASSAGGGGGGA